MGGCLGQYLGGDGVGLSIRRGGPTPKGAPSWSHGVARPQGDSEGWGRAPGGVLDSGLCSGSKAGRLEASPGHRGVWDLARQRVGSTQVRQSHPEPVLVFQNPNCQLCTKQQDGSWW